MGNQTARLSYIESLPTDLKSQLSLYITDIRDIHQLLCLPNFNGNIQKNVKTIDYGRGYRSDCQDVFTTIDTILQFKAVEICQVPIMATHSNELIKLAAHPTLKEFSVTIPKKEISEHTDDVLNNVIKMFEAFIVNRRSIKDMKIFICPQFKFNVDNIAPFFNQHFTSKLDIIKHGNFHLIADAFSTTPIKNIYATPVVLIYKNASLLVDPYYPLVSGYEKLLNLLHESDNISSLIYAFAPISDQIPDMIRQKVTLDKIYITGSILSLHYDAFRLLFSNTNITRLQYNMDVCWRMTPTEQNNHYSECLKLDMSLVLGSTQFNARDKPVQIIYPFNLKNIASVFLSIPNIDEIGIYDYIDIDNFIIDYLLEKVKVVHIFTMKPDTYTHNELLQRYSDRIVIEN